MLTSALLAIAASVATASAQVYKGFNYGSTFTNDAAKVQADFQNEFTTAQRLVGTSGFSSARLYTMIQGGTTNTPIEAIPAAIATKTTLLLGLWASAGQANFNNELAALSSAIKTYGTAFTDLIAGISVGSEDLYRISPTGIINLSGAGAQPADVANYIGQVRSLVAGTGASGKPIGHVDTWTAWVNSTNQAVINACDFIGMDAYPYFENTLANSIGNSRSQFFSAYDATIAAVGGKPVWVTETGWPVSGPTQNQAVPSTANAKTYWDEVGCSLFGTTNTWWYVLQDAAPTTPSPSFGIVGSTLSTTPLYDLTCPAASSSSSAAASSATAASGASSASSVSVTSVSSASATTALPSVSRPDNTANGAGSSAPASSSAAVSSAARASSSNAASSAPAASASVVASSAAPASSKAAASSAASASSRVAVSSAAAASSSVAASPAPAASSKAASSAAPSSSAAVASSSAPAVSSAAGGSAPAASSNAVASSANSAVASQTTYTSVVSGTVTTYHTAHFTVSNCPSGSSAAGSASAPAGHGSAPAGNGSATATTYRTAHLTVSNCPSGSSAAGSASAPAGHGSAPAGNGSATATTYHTARFTVSNCPSGSSAAGSASAPAGSPPQSVASTLATVTKTSAPASNTASASSCPADLSGSYEFPHLIVPVDSSAPDKAYGTSYNGKISSTVSSIFNFDIPASDAGKTCSLVFLLPAHDQLQTSAYTLTGSGGISVAELTAPATEQTTYNTVPKVAVELGTTQVKEGGAYVVTSHACGAGQRIAFEVRATGSLKLDFFQDYNPSPLGFYVRVC